MIRIGSEPTRVNGSAPALTGIGSVDPDRVEIDPGQRIRPGVDQGRIGSESTRVNGSDPRVDSGRIC